MTKLRISPEIKRNLNLYLGWAFFVTIPIGFTLSLLMAAKYGSEIPNVMVKTLIMSSGWSVFFGVLGYIFKTGVITDYFFEDAGTAGGSVPDPAAAVAPQAQAPAQQPKSEPSVQPPASIAPMSTPAPINLPPQEPPAPQPGATRPPAHLPPTGLPPMATPPPMSLPVMNTPMPGELPKNPPEPVPEDEEFPADNEFSEESAPPPTDAGEEDSGPFSGMGGGRK